MSLPNGATFSSVCATTFGGPPQGGTDVSEARGSSDDIMAAAKRVAIERIRAALAASATPDMRVSERRRNYVFDEATAGIADIDVQRGEEFVLAVLAGAPDDLETRIWHRFVPEVWFADAATRVIVQVRRGEEQRSVQTGELMTAQVPGLVLSLARVFEGS
jgi:hypothetical protein